MFWCAVSLFIDELCRILNRPTGSLKYKQRVKIYSIIIWQGSLEVDPSGLIGSFLVWISPCGPFP